MAIHHSAQKTFLASNLFSNRKNYKVNQDSNSSFIILNNQSKVPVLGWSREKIFGLNIIQLGWIISQNLTTYMYPKILVLRWNPEKNAVSSDNTVNKMPWKKKPKIDQIRLILLVWCRYRWIWSFLPLSCLSSLQEGTTLTANQQHWL